MIWIDPVDLPVPSVELIIPDISDPIFLPKLAAVSAGGLIEKH